MSTYQSLSGSKPAALLGLQMVEGYQHTSRLGYRYLEIPVWQLLGPDGSSVSRLESGQFGAVVPAATLQVQGQTIAWVEPPASLSRFGTVQAGWHLHAGSRTALVYTIKVERAVELSDIEYGVRLYAT